MRTLTQHHAAACFIGLLAVSQFCYALSHDDQASRGQASALEGATKAISTQTLGSRGTVNTGATLYGGFEIMSGTTVYILVRGNSLGSLGITSNYLDAPRVRIFNSQNQDLITDNLGRAGFNGCSASNSGSAPVVNFYQNRGAAQERDACAAQTLSAGVYTFSVTPSVPGVTSNSTTSSPASGEVLFEVTLGAAPPVENNLTKTQRLLGGTWTFSYVIGSSGFTERYAFQNVVASTTTPGDYNAFGTDQFGDPVIGGFVGRLGQWGLLDRSIILDRFFTFTFSDLNHVAGCYYQLTPPGSTNLGTCYSMSGVRNPFKMWIAPSKEGQLMQDRSEKAAVQSISGEQSEFDPNALNGLLRLQEDFRGR